MAIKNNTVNVLREVDRLITKGLEEITPKIESTAKKTVVVVTGKLQRSITTKIEDKKAVIGSSLVYAPKVEMDKPFLRVALENNMTNIRKAFNA